MEKVELNLKNCYGIKGLKETLAFKSQGKNRNRFIGIYSPNGMMKTSFAKTFLCVEKGETVPNDEYGNKPEKKILIDQSDIAREDILVVESFDSNLNNLDVAGSSALLLNDKLKKEYDKLLAEEKEKRVEILSGVKTKSGLSEDEFYKEVEEVFGSTLEEVIKGYVSNNNPAEDQSTLLNIKYKKFFNKSLKQVCDSHEVKEKFKEYHQKVSAIGFFSDKFTPAGFCAVKNSLKKNEFFNNNKNKIVVYDDKEEEKEFKTVEEMKEFIEGQISIAAEPIINILNKNGETRDIAEYLHTNPGLVSRLDDIENLKKDVLLAYFSEKQEQCSAFLSVIEKNKEEISKIEKKAGEEETVWENVLEIFKKRFSVPFDIAIKNKQHAILVGSEQIKYFDFKIKRGKENATKNSTQDLNFLSTGEKKALYILRVIFNIEMKKREMETGKELLIILDDIVDSFDYRNKYAVLQYLKDFKENKNEKSIYFIILTHNFDFFRNLVRKDILKGDFENKLIAISKEGNVSIDRFESHIIQNAFEKLADGGNIGSIKTVACIPFLRTLLEMRGEKKGNLNYESLTSMLHVNKDSDQQTVSKIGDVYAEVLKKKLTIDNSSKNKQVREYIGNVIEKEIMGAATPTIKESELYKKVCLSVGVRLLAEEFCINKLGKKVDDITDSTKIFLDFLEKENMESDEKELIKSVSMGTPDYIHTNSFMYEPLIDQSSDELLLLYNTLKGRVNRMDGKRNQV